jgi:hypothetical protein
MKELSPEKWLYWLGVFATLCMLLPIVMILLKKQLKAGSIALSIYFLLTFIYNFLYIIFPATPVQTMRVLGVITNLMDAPLILLFLRHFTFHERIRKRIRVTMALYIAFEIVVLCLYGFGKKTITVFSGPGILLVLYFSFILFSRHIRLAGTQKVDIARIMMISGIFFAYGVFFMLYLFFYVLNTPNTSDALLIYYLATIIASMLLSAGLIKEKPRVKKQPGSKARSQSGPDTHRGAADKVPVL